MLTFKPAVRHAWAENLERHIDFEGRQFVSRDGSLGGKDIDPERPVVCFGSFQDFLQRTAEGAIKPRNEWVHETKWDCVVLDEYHHGAWRENAKGLFGADEAVMKALMNIEGFRNLNADLATIINRSEQIKDTRRRAGEGEALTGRKKRQPSQEEQERPQAIGLWDTVLTDEDSVGAFKGSATNRSVVVRETAWVEAGTGAGDSAGDPELPRGERGELLERPPPLEHSTTSLGNPPRQSVYSPPQAMAGSSPISTSSGVLEELAWRGLLHQTAGEGIEGHLRQPRVVYCGFDPTSDALTIGNFMPLKLLAHWQRAGHTPLVVMGGGTGLIGDPSGKSSERQLLTPERVRANVEAQRPTFERVLDFSPGLSSRAVILNNLDWLGRLGFIEALRDIGKHFSVNQMIARDSVSARLHSREQGISYTEFSYVLLQAWDFVHLHRAHGCTVQAGGSDQYGNIVSGMDLVRRLDGADSFGVTAPLLLNRDGSKIGKSEKGAVYLSAHRTSPYAFHQFWLNVADDEIGRYLRFFTFMTREEIEALEAEHDADRAQRKAQRALARAMTELFHGPTELARAEQAAEALFSGDVRSLDAGTLHEVFAEVPHSVHSRAGLEGEGMSLVELLPLTSLATSRREAKDFLAAGAVSVNGEKAPADRRLGTNDLLHGRTILLRRGRRQWHATEWG